VTDERASGQPLSDADREALSRLLRQTELFRDLPEDAQAELLATIRPLVVPAGTIVCREGDSGDELFLIERGELETSATISGKETRLGVMHAGDLFGEIAVMSRGIRTATVTALSEAHMLVLTRVQLLGLVERTPTLGTTLRELMRRRVLRSRMRALQ
jgi:CRP-like cAMP-binding protein